MSRRRPDHIPAIAAVMTPFPWSVDAAAPLERAEALMEEHGIRHLPVTRDGRLAGIVSAAEIRLVKAASQREGLTVDDACTREAYVVDLSARLDGVLREMTERHLDAALVVRGERLAGIFTVSDACRSFRDLLLTLFPEDGGNDAA